jgi:Zn-dependent protease
MLEGSFARTLRFSVLGIPVEVELTFLFTTLLLAGSRRQTTGAFVTWLAVVFVSILLHELGHAFVGRTFGLTPTIRIYGWGGLTSWTAGGPLSHLRSLLVSMAGPAVGIAVGTACFLIKDRVDPGNARLHGVLDDLVFVNAVWGFVNLAPILPLDGGQACEAVWGMIAPRHAAQGARAVSTLTGLGAGALALTHGWTIPGAYAVWLGLDSARRFQGAREAVRDEALIARLTPVFSGAIDAGDGPAIIAAAAEALRAARTAYVRTWLLENLALGRAMTGAFDAAAEALAAAPPARPPAVKIEAFVVAAAARARQAATFAELGLPAREGIAGEPWEEALERLRDPSQEAPDAELFGQLREAAEILRRDGDAARVGELLFEKAPDPDLALALACCWARAGDAGRATGYAVKAVELGQRDWERLAELRGLGAAFEKAKRAALGG